MSLSPGASLGAIPGSIARRVICFATSGWELVVIDTATLARTRVDVVLAAPSVADTFAMRADGRTIYYDAQRAEADIWIVERK